MIQRSKKEAEETNILIEKWGKILVYRERKDMILNHHQPYWECIQKPVRIPYSPINYYLFSRISP